MRTRRGLISYPGPKREPEWRRSPEEEEATNNRCQKRRRRGGSGENKNIDDEDRPLSDKADLFDGLPDDLIISILCQLSATAASPSDLVSVTLTYAPPHLP